MIKTGPLRLYQGDTYRGTVIVTDQGNPANLTGYTATAQIRTDVADLDPDPPVATFTCTIPTPDTIALYLDPVTSRGLPEGPLVWDLQVANGTDVYTLLRGPVYIGRQITA
jgi:hypothetical protein